MTPIFHLGGLDVCSSKARKMRDFSQNIQVKLFLVSDAFFSVHSLYNYCIIKAEKRPWNGSIFSLENKKNLLSDMSFDIFL